MSCANTTVAPMVLPISNITFAGKTTSLKRAMQISLGNPPQQLYFLPSVLDDALAVADPGICANADNFLGCAGQAGGFYAFNESSTWSGIRLELWNGSHTTQNGRKPDAVFNDELRMNNVSIYGFPATEYNISTSDTPNMLGINNSSYFLSIIKSMNLVPSKSWGMWLGEYGIGSSTGSLVLGGYDQARVSGNFTRFNMTADDFLTRLYVLSIEYNTPNGTSIPLLQQTKGTATVVVSPENGALELGASSWDIFVNATGITQYSSLKSWGWPTGTELGNLTVRFANGYNTTLPARDLWQPYVTQDTDGTVKVANESITVSRVSRRANPAAPRFGYPFLASNYMTFHPDDNYIMLAPVNRDPNIQPSIQAICDEPQADSGNAATRHSSTSANAAVIAGAVVGAVAGLALILTIIKLTLMLRKRRIKTRARPTPTYSEMPGSTGSETDYLRSKTLPQTPIEMLSPGQCSELPADPWPPSHDESRLSFEEDVKRPTLDQYA